MGEPGLRRLWRGDSGTHHPHRQRPGIHAAGDLLQRPACAAGVSGGGRAAPGRRCAAAPRPAAGRDPVGAGAEVNALAIDVRGLTKRYDGRAVVDDVTLQVGQGRICGFLGPNGSGKTTTIRMLCGLLRPDAGEGQCLGLDFRREAAAIKRQVGYMTQKFGLYDDLSIRENLDFVARLFELPGRRAAVDRALEQLGLQARQRQLAGTLSGGWKQRLALAACLIHGPRLLLLDEPTAGVDPKARRDFWDQIHRLAAEGITVLVSTHYMDEAARCHDLVYIAYGKVLARGNEREIVDAAGLSVWALEGSEAQDLSERLRALPGVQNVVAFGNTLHVAGRDAALLAQSLGAFQGESGVVLRETRANLEDVFISLIDQAQDNFGNGQAGQP
ncbi:ABC transporter ATP-binding protein [Hydrogenophaga sp. D2P1]|uniref:ABC transporter ATP-binding protein n=1 Tax=Hydrogenophaga aromaticivorans TaxID=2610898 RepID=A0A7Y8H2F0_9BURK|nr:ABC transporter ATP-binding protein [Hydrogenophaga aromaticivorans]